MKNLSRRSAIAAGGAALAATTMGLGIKATAAGGDECFFQSLVDYITARDAFNVSPDDESSSEYLQAHACLNEAHDRFMDSKPVTLEGVAAKVEAYKLVYEGSEIPECVLDEFAELFREFAWKQAASMGRAVS